MRNVSLAAALAISISAAAFAQQNVTGATVSGAVEDSSGAPVTGAAVTIRNRDTNLRQQTTSDARGRFRVATSQVGNYELTVEKDGFATSRVKLQLTIGGALDVPVKLMVATSATIEVASERPVVVETARTQVASTITPEEVHNLPLNGRNYLDLALLAPGVSRTNTGANQRFAETSAVPGTGISVSTQRNLANSFVVDGLSSNDDAAELAGTFYSQEVIREFQVVRSSGTAELGRASAGVINIVTQSGTNALRGDAYGYFRDQSFDSKNPLSSTKLPLSQQQYGASLGGPLIRDRAFFFSNFEQMRQKSGGVITINPANVTAINTRLDVAGYSGPRISTGAFDTSLDATNVFARGDFNLAPENQLVVRYSLYDVASSNARNVGGLNAISRGTRLDDRDNTFALGDTWSLSDTILTETRGQWTRSRLSAPPNDVNAPAVNISGIASFGVATFSPTARDIDLAELSQTVMTIHGGHSLKAGADWLQNRVRIGFPGAIQGVYSFQNLTNFLAGNFSTFQQAFGLPETHQTNNNFGVFVQDEWRTGRRVTINAGVRYDVQLLPSFIHTDHNNISPRLGVAWDPFGDGRSVVRASGGLYYDRIPLRAVSNALQRDGVTYRIVQVGAASPVAPRFPNAFASMPATIPTNITTIDPNIHNGYTVQAALQYERQIGSTAAASIGYEHMRGHEIIMSRNVNVPTTTDPTVSNLGRPDPRFGNNGQFQSIGESWYDGLTVAIDGRPASWGRVRLAYTFSKGLDTAGNFFFSQPQNAKDIRAERGRSDNDQRHRLTLSGTFVTPVANLSYMCAYASALPFNIQVPFDRNGDTNFNDRPAGVGRNTGRGFDYQSLDLRLSRVFAAGRGLSLEGIVDAFNVLNRANYQVPNNILGSPTFGRPTAANDPRQLQVGVRVGF